MKRREGLTSGDQSENKNGSRLSDSMSSVHGLKIGLRVPIRIEEDDGIGSDEVDSLMKRRKAI